MKRKFLSLMVAACTAFCSFTGLTGCSNDSSASNSDESYPGYMTYADWAERGCGFFITGAGSVWMRIMPTGQVEGVTNFDYGDNYEYAPANGIMMMASLEFSNSTVMDCAVTYQITEYATTVDGKNLPVRANLYITFGDAADTTNLNVLKAMGFVETVEIYSSMALRDLIFTGNGGYFQFTNQTDDNEPRSFSGTFMIVEP